MMRKMGNTMVPTVEIAEENGEFELKTITTFKTTSIKFKLGEPFEEETADGRKVTVSAVGPGRVGSGDGEGGSGRVKSRMVEVEGTVKSRRGRCRVGLRLV